MKLIVNFFISIYRAIERIIINPITKTFYIINRKFDKNSKAFEIFLSKRNTLVIISLILSLCYFFFVDVNTTNLIKTSAEIIYNQPVNAIYNDQAYVVEGLPESVDITLIGKTSDLYLAKQISNHEITADLTDLKPGTHKIKLKYNQALSNVKYKLDPTYVTVVVSDKKSTKKTVSVDVLNKDLLDSKLNVASISVDRDEVVIKGSQDSIKNVAIVKALVDLNNLANPQVGTNTLKDVPLVAYDKQGKIVNVEIVPDKINVNVEINSPSKEVLVKVELIGNPVIGKSVSSINSDVNKVTIYGDEEVLNKTNYISIPIDITNINENKKFKVDIKKPVGIRYMSINNASVDITLDKEINKDITDIRLDSINLNPSLTVEALSAEDASITVVVKGVESVINTITKEDIKAYINLEGYGVGIHEVDVIVEGQDARVNYLPKTKKVKVEIKEKTS